MSPAEWAAAPVYEPSGYLMIRSMELRNFRCFEHLKIENCRRFNVIVGDNGAGKTTLLEAMFLALSSNVETSIRLKAQRGFNTSYSGPPRAIEEAIWRDYFFNLDWNRAISIDLNGSGPENRSLTISRGPAEILIPFEGLDQKESGGSIAPLTFSWRAADGKTYQSQPQITPQGIQLGTSSEYLPDFFLFAANQTVSAGESATRFSVLSRERRERDFVSVFSREYPWIEDLNIEVVGGFPIIHATLVNTAVKLPLNSVSGGINRIVSIMLALASQPRSLMLVDEIEDGIFYKHKTGLWRAILELARKYDGQMFLTTHDEEWLGALVEATGDQVDDVALWRIERGDKGHEVVQFDGRTLKAGLEHGAEVRSEKDMTDDVPASADL